ncbi:PINc/VapC family ATPase [Candidatus Nanobsidianus stetteri]|uniref:ATPase n=1 Tax=Nanobsidianus stetteri TaxID=1294122 RepID=A0A2T9WLB0_NANST|nr:ATPase, T2SS/T4P/T4SS family [Candidatus Nanobsidianus stetteri]MCC5447245.1 Flp pilus assembly complex ATPase component TadA [Candidatus Nanobsidianus stetteri]
MKLNKITLDTSVVIDEYISKSLLNNSISFNEVIIPVPVIDELQAQANKGLEKGLIGLKELQKIRELSEKYNYKVTILGEKPTLEQIKLAKHGYIDYLIIKIARDTGSTLLTSDKILYETAKVYNVDCLLIEKEDVSTENPPFLDLFTDDTISVHIIENTKVKRKRGKPGEWYLEEVDKVYGNKDMEDLIDKIIYIARNRRDSFIEEERKNSLIIQLGIFRIVIVKPPLSDAYEITIVKPSKILRIEDYNLNERILERLKEKSEGIIIVGKPGSGKTTFAQALAEYYLSMKKIVKTVESPRDLILSPDIVQYSKNYSTDEEIHNILLLSRPDYVIFDEMRDTRDFKLYIDLRLAGIGMIGVAHAERPIDIVHRLLSRTELGLIPQIIDTIIYINKGQIEKVYYLNLTVKIPHGLKEEDLARPVVEVRDFLTNDLEYEIYTFGEEIMVVPIKKYRLKSGIQRFLEDLLNIEYKRKYNNIYLEVLDDRIIFYIPKELKRKFIRNEKRYLMSIRDKYNLRIEIKNAEKLNEIINFDYEISKDYLTIMFNNLFRKREVELYINGELIGKFKINKKGKIVLDLNSEIGKEILEAINNKSKIEFKLV